MLHLIHLHGAAAGSAILETTNNGTSFELRRRVRRPAATFAEDNGMRAYLITETEIAGAEIVNGRGTAPVRNARGIIIVDMEGRIVAEGANGLSRERIAYAKEQIGILVCSAAAGTKQATQVPVPGSSAARAIVDSARRLFHGTAEDTGFETAVTAVDGPESETGSRSVEPGNTDKTETAAADPFPNIFPGGAWTRCSITGTLTGFFVLNGRTYRAAAVPFSRNGSGSHYSERTVRGADGRLYRVIAFRDL